MYAIEIALLLYRKMEMVHVATNYINRKEELRKSQRNQVTLLHK